MALAAILLAGGVLMVPPLGRQSLWTDEAFTVLPALEAKSAEDLVERTLRYDTQPPASHFALYLTRDWLPDGERGARLPSFLATQAGILFLFLTVRRCWGVRPALLAAALSQFSPFLMHYAAEARNYGLWFLVVCASWWLLVLWHEAVRSGRGSPLALAAGWGLVSALGLWTHLFHLFSLLGQAAVAAILAWKLPAGGARRLAARSALTAGAVCAFGFLPWALVLLRESAKGDAGVGWARPLSIKTLLATPYAFLFGMSWGPTVEETHTVGLAGLLGAHPVAFALAAMAAATFLISWGLLVRRARASTDAEWELLPLVVAPGAGLLAPLLLAGLRAFPLHPRHLLFLWPLVPVVLALALDRFARLRPLLLVPPVLFLVALANLLWNDAYAKPDERAAVRYAELHSGPSALVIGRAAPFYTRRAGGRLQDLTDPRQADLFLPETTDVWWIDNRRWEDPEGRYRRKLQKAVSLLGLEYQGSRDEFAGLVLHHWARPVAGAATP